MVRRYADRVKSMINSQTMQADAKNVYLPKRKHPKHFIQGAIKHPGALTAEADKEGESPMTFAAEHKHDSGKTGQRARFALTLRGLAGKKK